MELEHTKGPWFTKREGFSTVYVEARLRAGVIQEVAACGPTEAGPEQQEANARLIATAPDLLSACLAVMEAHAEFQRECPNVTGEAPCLGLVREAVAKATGGAQ